MPVPSHPLLAQAADQVGGRQAFNLAADRAHFLRIYAELVKHETAEKGSFPTVQILYMARSSSPAQIGNAIQAGGYREPASPGDKIHV